MHRFNASEWNTYQKTRPGWAQKAIEREGREKTCDKRRIPCDYSLIFRGRKGHFVLKRQPQVVWGDSLRNELSGYPGNRYDSRIQRYQRDQTSNGAFLEECLREGWWSQTYGAAQQDVLWARQLQSEYWRAGLYSGFTRGKNKQIIAILCKNPHK